MNGFYGSWCYLPLLAFLTFDREREPVSVRGRVAPRGCADARPSITAAQAHHRAPAGALLKARILIRLDGGFAAPELFVFLDAVGFDYIVAIAKNKTLERLPLDMTIAEITSDRSGEPERV